MRGWAFSLGAVFAATILMWVVAVADEGGTEEGGDVSISATADEPLSCAELIEQGTAKVDKGKKIRGRGLRFRDKALEDKGLALYQEGKRLLERAAALSDACAAKIAALEKKSADYKIRREEKDRYKSYF